MNALAWILSLIYGGKLIYKRKRSLKIFAYSSFNQSYDEQKAKSKKSTARPIFLAANIKIEVPLFFLPLNRNPKPAILSPPISAPPPFLVDKTRPRSSDSLPPITRQTLMLQLSLVAVDRRRRRPSPTPSPTPPPPKHSDPLLEQLQQRMYSSKTPIPPRLVESSTAPGSHRRCRLDKSSNAATHTNVGFGPFCGARPLKPHTQFIVFRLFLWCLVIIAVGSVLCVQIVSNIKLLEIDRLFH